MTRIAPASPEELERMIALEMGGSRPAAMKTNSWRSWPPRPRPSVRIHSANGSAEPESRRSWSDVHTSAPGDRKGSSSVGGGSHRRARAEVGRAETR